MTAEVTPLSFDVGKEVSLGLEKMVSSDGLKPVYQKARKDFLNELIAQRPDFGPDRLALMERASYLHARIKQKESMGGYSSEQNYTMANKTFLETMSQLHKLDSDYEDLEKQKKEFMEVVAESVKYATQELDSETQRQVLFLLNKKFEELNG